MISRPLLFFLHGGSVILSHSMSNSMKNVAVRRTFYRRPLPDSCTALSSKQGRDRFESAMKTKGLKSFFPLVEQYTTQSEPAYCGISTLVVALNALAIDPRQVWKEPWRWYEESMLNCCVDLEEMKKTGVTLKDFACLATCQGIHVDAHYADEKDTIDNFRKVVHQACVETENDELERLQHVLIVSYNRQVLGQTGTGHFSPIAAYDSVSDSVLILDTARFKYGAHWVPLSLIYKAMQPKDPDTGRSRGYVLLTSVEDDDDDDQLHHPPFLSILFQSKMKQNPTRRLFKDYLKSLDHEITWQEVVRYWTKDGQDPSYIWQLVEPQLKPCEDENHLLASIQQVLDLINNLLPPKEQAFDTAAARTCVSNSCGPNHCRKLSMNSEQALFVVYLACLDKGRRSEIVFDTERSAASEEARQQLLAEGELIRVAVEMSDQSTHFSK